MGRLVLVALLGVMVLPALFLGRLWRSAADRRLVDRAALGFVSAGPAATRALAAWGRRTRQGVGLGVLAGVVLAGAVAVTMGTRSVFAWPFAVAVGLLAGVLAGQVVRPRSSWPSGRPARPRVADVIAPALVWTGRLLAVAAVAGGVLILRSDRPDPRLGWAVIAVAVLAQVAAEATLGRSVRGARAVDAEDGPTDEAIRSAGAHVAVAAASVLTAGALAVASLTAGFVAVESGGGATSDVLDTGAIALGLAAALLAVVVAAFLPAWVTPPRRTSTVPG